MPEQMGGKRKNLVRCSVSWECGGARHDDMRTRRRHASNYIKRMGGIAKIPSRERAAVRRAILSNRARLDAPSLLRGMEDDIEARTERGSERERRETEISDATRMGGRTVREKDFGVRTGFPCEMESSSIAREMDAQEGPIALKGDPFIASEDDEEALDVGEEPKTGVGTYGRPRVRRRSASKGIASALAYHVEALDMPRISSILYSKTNFHTVYPDINYFHACNLIAYVQKKLLDFRRKMT